MACSWVREARVSALDRSQGRSRVVEEGCYLPLCARVLTRAAGPELQASCPAPSALVGPLAQPQTSCASDGKSLRGASSDHCSHQFGQLLRRPD